MISSSFKYGCIGKDKEADIIKKHNKKNNIISKYLTVLKTLKHPIP